MTTTTDTDTSPATEVTIRAKFDSHCRVCGEDIRVGARVKYAPKAPRGNKVRHLDCRPADEVAAAVLATLQARVAALETENADLKARLAMPAIFRPRQVPEGESSSAAIRFSLLELD